MKLALIMICCQRTQIYIYIYIRKQLGRNPNFHTTISIDCIYMTEYNGTFTLSNTNMNVAVQVPIYSVMLKQSIEIVKKKNRISS